MEQAATFYSPEMVEARALLNRVLEKDPKQPFGQHMFLRAYDTKGTFL